MLCCVAFSILKVPEHDIGLWPLLPKDGMYGDDEKYDRKKKGGTSGK